MQPASTCRLNDLDGFPPLPEPAQRTGKAECNVARPARDLAVGEEFMSVVVDRAQQQQQQQQQQQHTP